MRKQAKFVDQLKKILVITKEAQKAIELVDPWKACRLFKKIFEGGNKPDAEPFIKMMLQAFLAAKLEEIRTKTRIFIKDGRTLMNCLDETCNLDDCEVFIQLSDNEGSSSSPKVIEGMMIVESLLASGGYLFLHDVDKKDLHHIMDCDGFPQKGER